MNDKPENVAPFQNKPEKSEKFKRREARIKRLREIKQTKRVRVVPRDDNMRRLLRHPSAGKFLVEGSSEWPLDHFTKRRLREGSVTLEEQSQQAQSTQQEQRPRPRRGTEVPTAQ